MTKKIRMIFLDPKMAKRSGSRILGVGVVPALNVLETTDEIGGEREREREMGT